MIKKIHQHSPNVSIYTIHTDPMGKPTFTYLAPSCRIYDSQNGGSFWAMTVTKSWPANDLQRIQSLITPSIQSLYGGFLNMGYPRMDGL